MGAVVWWTGKPYNRVHAVEDCPSAARRGSHHQRQPVRQFDLAEITAPKLCVSCFPDAPRRIRVHHPICRICRQSRALPCEHNGGVQVAVRVRNGHKTYKTDKPVRKHFYITRWVWPENAAYHQLLDRLVNSSQPS